MGGSRGRSMDVLKRSAPDGSQAGAVSWFPVRDQQGRSEKREDLRLPLRGPSRIQVRVRGSALEDAELQRDQLR